MMDLFNNIQNQQTDSTIDPVEGLVSGIENVMSNISKSMTPQDSTAQIHNDTQITQMPGMDLKEANAMQISGPTSTIVKPNLPTATMLPEIPWDIQRLVSKPIRYASLDITESSPIDTIVATHMFPQSFLNVNGASCSSNHLSDLFSRFAYCRFNLVITATLASTQFDRGMLKFVSLPIYRHDGTFPAGDLVNRIYSTPGTVMNLKEGNSITHIIPWQYFRSYLSTNQTFGLLEILPTLYTVILSRVRTTTNSGTNRTLDYWVHLDNAEFKIPQYKYLNSTYDDYATNIHGDQEETEYNIGLSRVSGAFPTRAQSGSMENFQDQLSTITNHSSVRLAAGKYYSNESQASSETKNDDMLIQNLVSKFSKLMYFTTDADTVPNTILASWDVHPMLRNANWITPLAYVSNAFEYWRGGIEYKIIGVKSNFSKLKVAFVYVPNPALTPTRTPQELLYGDYYKSEADFSTVSEHSFVIPYMHNVAYSLVGTSNNNVVTSNAPGRIYMINLTRTVITQPGDVIDFSIYVRGAKDFQLAAPRAPLAINLEKNNAYIQNVFNSLRSLAQQLAEPILKAQSGAVESEQPSFGHEPESSTIMSLPSTTPLSLYNSIEPVTSIKVCLNRACMLKDAVTTAGTNTFLDMPIAPHPIPAPLLTTLSYFQKMYAFWSGSLEIFMISTDNVNDRSQIFTRVTPLRTNFSYAGGFPMHAFHACRGSTARFSLPYYSVNPTTNLYTYGPISNISIARQPEFFSCWFIAHGINMPEGQNYTFYISAGDDFSFSSYRGIPSKDSIGRYIIGEILISRPDVFGRLSNYTNNMDDYEALTDFILANPGRVDFGTFVADHPSFKRDGINMDLLNVLGVFEPSLMSEPPKIIP